MTCCSHFSVIKSIDAISHWPKGYDFAWLCRFARSNLQQDFSIRTAYHTVIHPSRSTAPYSTEEYTTWYLQRKDQYLKNGARYTFNLSWWRERLGALCRKDFIKKWGKWTVSLYTNCHLTTSFWYNFWYVDVLHT